MYVDIELVTPALNHCSTGSCGTALRCDTIHLGYGRRRAGTIGPSRGSRLYLRTPRAVVGTGLQVIKPLAVYHLACTQTHFNMDGATCCFPARSKIIEEKEHLRKNRYMKTTSCASAMYPSRL